MIHTQKCQKSVKSMKSKRYVQNICVLLICLPLGGDTKVSFAGSTLVSGLGALELARAAKNKTCAMVNYILISFTAKTKC